QECRTCEPGGAASGISAHPAAGFGKYSLTTKGYAGRIRVPVQRQDSPNGQQEVLLPATFVANFVPLGEHQHRTRAGRTATLWRERCGERIQREPGRSRTSRRVTARSAFPPWRRRCATRRPPRIPSPTRATRPSSFRTKPPSEARPLHVLAAVDVDLGAVH